LSEDGGGGVIMLVHDKANFKTNPIENWRWKYFILNGVH